MPKKKFALRFDSKIPQTAYGLHKAGEWFLLAAAGNGIGGGTPLENINAYLHECLTYGKPSY